MMHDNWNTPHTETFIITRKFEELSDRFENYV